MGEAERNDAVGRAQGFHRDHFMQTEKSREGNRGMGRGGCPAIQTFALPRFTTGGLPTSTGVDFHGVGLRGEPHKGQTADQGDYQPHESNLISSPLLSNGVGGRKSKPRQGRISLSDHADRQVFLDFQRGREDNIPTAASASPPPPLPSPPKTAPRSKARESHET